MVCIANYKQCGNVEQVVEIWDLFLVDKWKVIFRIALAIMKSKRQKIYKVAPDNIQSYLRKIHRSPDFNMSKLIADSATIEISNRLLQSLREKVESGAQIKKIHLRFDARKGKRVWEFEEEKTGNTTPLVKGRNKSTTRNLQNNRSQSKSSPNIFFSFFDLLKSQFDFSQKEVESVPQPLIQQKGAM